MLLYFRRLRDNFFCGSLFGRRLRLEHTHTKNTVDELIKFVSNFNLQLII